MNIQQQKNKDCSKYENCTSNVNFEFETQDDFLHIVGVGCWGVYCDQGDYMIVKKGKVKKITRGQKGVSDILKMYKINSDLNFLPIDCMLLAGDNIYKKGIPLLEYKDSVNEDSENDMSSQIREGFENCFFKSGINKFFIAIGNHDIETCDVLNQQINYDGWIMKSLRYSIVYNLNSQKTPFQVGIIVIDTNLYTEDPVCNQEDYDQVENYRQEQEKWALQVKKDFVQRGVKHILLMGHIPYVGNKKKKDDSNKNVIEEKEKSLLRKFVEELKPDIYFCADTHNQQLIVDNGIVNVIAGSGGTDQDSLPPKDEYVKGTVYAEKQFGFVSFQFTQDILISFVTHDSISSDNYQETSFLVSELVKSTK